MRSRFVFDRALFLRLFAAFIVCTIAGTLLHESGHYVVGLLQGRIGMHIGYAYTTHGDYPADEQLTRLEQVHYDDIIHHRHFPGEQVYKQLHQQVQHQDFLFTLGGPVQTMLTGTLGFAAMLIGRRRFLAAQRLGVWQWLLVFLSFFWLREAVNLFMIWMRLLLEGEYKMRADEFRLAIYLGWSPWSIQVAGAIVAVAIAAVVSFRYVPLQQRFSFVLAALAGGICGYVFWLETWGPVVMP